MPEVTSCDPQHHHYLYAIVRQDIQMSSGKLAAQAGHAYTDSLLAALTTAPARVDAYQDPTLGGSKVTLKAKRLSHLLDAYRDALSLDIPCAIIVDRHHVHPPDFDGSPIITALGIGPCTKAEARTITKRFSLLTS